MNTRLAIFALLVHFYSTSVFPSNHQDLFNGIDFSGWETRKGSIPEWKIQDGYLEVVPGKGDIQTKELFTDFDLHVEFWIPYLPNKHGQDRGNSGIFLQGRYEIQVLDSYQNDTYANGACGSLYKIIAPLVNASLPPENWQTYDIHFMSPRVDGKGHVTDPGHLTLYQNGTLMIDDGRFSRGTGSEGNARQGVPGPVRLQDHGSRVRFRNLMLMKR